jgi:nucleoside-diphosphate-sugar epimerase
MKAIVTGGAGFIGSHITNRLLEEGYKVTVVDDLSSGKKENLPEHESLKIVKKSICDDMSLEFEGVEVVFHLAALPQVQFSIENPKETHEVNVNGTLNILEHARKAGVKRVVFSSSSAIYGDQDELPLKENMTPNPLSPYAAQKLIGENYMELYSKIYGVECISLRYFNVFGPRQNPAGSYACLIPKFISLIETEKTPVINGDGNQTRDFVYVSDVVEANFRAATTQNKESFGKTFNIGGANQYSVNQIAKILIEMSGKSITPEHGPSVIEPHDTLADIQKAQNFLSWNPTKKFEDGIKETYDFFIA